MTIAEDSSVGVLRALMRGLSTARLAYVLGARWWGPSLFLNTKGSIREISERRLEQTVSILPPHTPSPEFFHVLLGALRVTPRLISQGDAIVHMRCAERSATYAITLPPKLGLARRLRHALTPSKATNDALLELVQQQHELQKRYLTQKASAQRLRKRAEQLRKEIAERKEAEERLQRAQKMELVGRLAGGMAHNFNNMLHILTGHTHLLQQALPSDSELQGDLLTMQETTEKGATLIKQLMAFSSRQVRQLSPMLIGPLLRKLHPLLLHLVGDKIDLSLNLPQTEHAIYADPADIEQIVVNLVANSRDAMPDGSGCITIGTSSTTIDDELFVSLEVQDNGMGMDESTRLQAFDPFFTTKPAELGTGLGLATTYSVVDQYGGAIGIQSHRGAGTTVTIRLPVTAPTRDDSLLTESGTPKLAGGETILVIEQRHHARASTCRILAAHGYRVLDAPDRRSAIDLIQRQAIAVDLLVSAIVIPGFGAPDFISKIRGEMPHLRGTILISGQSAEEPQSSLQLPRDVVLLRNPYSARDLLRAAGSLLERC